MPPSKFVKILFGLLPPPAWSRIIEDKVRWWWHFTRDWKLDNLLTICLNKVKKEKKNIVLTLPLWSSRRRGRGAWWPRSPGPGRPRPGGCGWRLPASAARTRSGTSRTLPRRCPRLQGPGKCLFKVFSFRIRQNIRILALRMRLALDSGCGSFQFKSLSSTPQLLTHVWSQISSRVERKSIACGYTTNVWAVWTR